MSLLGKIVALLNILGAIGVFSLASMDYAKRREWAYSLFMHDTLIKGLPTDSDQLDNRGRPIVEKMSDELLATILGPNAPVVRTQAEELQRVQTELEKRFATATTPGQKVFIGAQLNLPLARNAVDREQLVVCRKEFATPDTEKAFHDRLQAAYILAFYPPLVKGKPLDAAAWAKELPKQFEPRFRQNLREDAGGPANPFAADVAALTLGAPDFFANPAGLFDAALKEKFDGFFKTSVAQQGEALQKRFALAFDEAAHGQKELTTNAPKTVIEAHRVAVARLLFNLAPLIADPAPAAFDPDAADKVLSSPPYTKAFQRVVTVCGLEATSAGIAQQAALLEQISTDLNSAMATERLDFVAAHAFLLDLVRDQAYITQGEQVLLEVEKQNLAAIQAVVKKRQADVKTYEDKFAQLRAATAVEVEKLEAMTQKLHDLRIVLRDTRVKNLADEQQIRDLEKKIRDLENK
jgi:hypothetical protein